jgi:hypothetical protein
MDDFEIIEDYLKGKLKGQALKDFESRLVSDSAFASEVEEHRAMQDMLLTQGLMETREKLQTLRKIKQAKEGGKEGPFKGIGLVVITFLVLTSIIYVWTNKEKSPENRKTVSTPETVSEQQKQEEDKQKEEQEQEQEQSRKSGRTETIVQAQKTEDSIDRQMIAPSDTHTVKQKDQYPAIEPKTDPVIVPEALCAQVIIKAKVQTEESCQDKATGKIHLSQITGGKAPYRFLPDDSESPGQNSYFEHLETGKHKIMIIDANGCTTTVQADITGKPCQSEKSNIFAPDYGETWKFPVSAGGNCKIRIYEATGNIVYEVNTVNGYPSEWNGVGNNEGYIKAGAYLYQISCDDGAMSQGSVTVTR